MKVAPYRIEKLALDASRCQVRRLSIDRFRAGSSHYARNVNVSGYAVTSTAPYNTDEDRLNPAVNNSPKQAKKGIEAIAQDLHRIKTDPTICEPPQLIIAVHGYNSSDLDVRKWYHDIFRYAANNDRQISQNRNLVFVGYRWSSEQIFRKPKELLENLKALPDVPRNLLWMGIVLVVLYFGGLVAEILRSLEILSTAPISVRLLNLAFGSWNNWGKLIEVLILVGLQFIMGVALMVTIAMAVLWMLRVSVYFRDVYRAINFAVPDLTELIRQIDNAVMDLEENEPNPAYSVPIDALRQDKRSVLEAHQRIDLSFLGHSMGGLVITNVVRILSDVFDRRSIEQNPTAEIGNALRLGRLILASPDIPVLSVVSNRANGLASSLRRFDEAYLFSNEGDLALRLASTAANYISFPSTDHFHGHRLGSIALRNDLHEKGIINLPALQQKYSLDKTLCEALDEDKYDILKCLFITPASGGKDKYKCLGDLFKDDYDVSPSASLANLFTFFDCTDYRDHSLKLVESGMNERSHTPSGLLTRAHSRPHLSLKDYTELFFDMVRGKRNVHGGYFYGEYSRELIYRIAFLGFEGMLEAMAVEASSYPTEPTPKDKQTILQDFHF
ncbi:MAG: alpha/beta hydrolase, partial [Phormidesmis sp.]